MPMHDWTRVKSGTYHCFHQRWLTAIMDRLNAGILPKGWFALTEQRVGGPEADVLTLSRRGMEPPPVPGPQKPAPQTWLVERAENLRYTRKSDRIVIQHDLGEVESVIELISPGNKDTKHSLRAFARKSANMIRGGIHLSVIDPFPPGRYDRTSIHRAIWDQIASDGVFLPSAGQPLVTVAYEAGLTPTAYVNPFAVEERLPDLPLFLDEGWYVEIPLEETYQSAWAVMPAELRERLEPPPAASA